MKLLIDRGYRDLPGAFSGAILAYRNSVEITKLLLENGAKPLPSTNHQRSPISRAAEFGRLEILKLLLDTSDAQTRAQSSDALSLAASRGQLDVVKLLVNDYGFDVNGYTHISDRLIDQPSLFGFCYRTNPKAEVAEFLLKHGAKVNVQSASGNTPCKY